MFVQFVVPFDVRNDPSTYEWVVYHAVSRLTDVALLMPSVYWTEADRRKATGSWATLPNTERFFGYNTPSAADFDRLVKLPLSHDLLNDVASRFIGPNLIWAHTIRERIPALEAEIGAALEAAGNVEALLLWTNCASAKAAARRLGIPTIHNELGPLRPPFYRSTAYFDFEGVNGDTDATRRWHAFLEEAENVPTLARDELQDLFMREKPKPLSVVSKTHELGIALQCPDDSNMMSFSNGFTNYEAVATGQRYFPGSTLVRPHPQRPEQFGGFAVDWDTTDSPLEFLKRVGSLLTVNSSLGFEAMLAGKPSFVLGDASFKTGSWDIVSRRPPMSDSEMVRWLNWFAFGYLIPFDRVFDREYYRWRLCQPSETDTYMRNFEFWTGSLGR
jgi:hypothetical protein